MKTQAAIHSFASLDQEQEGGGAPNLWAVCKHGPHDPFAPKITKLNTKSPSRFSTPSTSSDCGDGVSEMIRYDSFAAVSLQPKLLSCRGRTEAGGSNSLQTSGGVTAWASPRDSAGNFHW